MICPICLTIFRFIALKINFNKMIRKLIAFSILAISFISCKNDGFHIVEDEDGNILEKFEITKDSIRNGTYQAFYEYGALLEECTYKMGKLEGVRKLYYPNGNIEIEEHYIDGKMNGEYKVFHESGPLELIQLYEMDNLRGESLKYYENGQLAERVVFVNGEENGQFQEYHPNGELQWEGEYLNGDNEVGLLKEYNEEGELIKKMMCDSLSVCRTIWTLKQGDIVPKN